MSRLRFTLAQLMALVIYLGFGLAALRNANPFWAGATYTLAIITIAAAPLGAYARRGTARLTWAGFAVFGWTYPDRSCRARTTGGYCGGRFVTHSVRRGWGEDSLEIGHATPPHPHPNADDASTVSSHQIRPRAV
jgi:hypothetical protein